jgi:hypothetical protein
MRIRYKMNIYIKKNEYLYKKKMRIRYKIKWIFIEIRYN